MGVAGFAEPEPDAVYCVSARLAEETVFEAPTVWTTPDSYPWTCYIYQVQSEALQFIVLRRPKEETDWKPKRVSDQQQPQPD